MKKIDIEKLKYNFGRIYHLLKRCKDILGEDFEITISKDGVSAKVKKGYNDNKEIILTAMYVMYLLFVSDNYDNLSKIGKTLIDNQFESFGEMLK